MMVSDDFNIIRIVYADTLILVQLESRLYNHRTVFSNFQDIDVISGARDVDAMMFVPITGHYAYKAGIGVIQYD